MSLAGRQRRFAFWGSTYPVLLSILFVALAAAFGIWNSADPLPDPVAGQLRLYVPIGASIVAAVLTGLDRHLAGKKSKQGREAVAKEAFDALTILETAVGKLSADDEFKAYFDEIVQKCGPKLFRERDVRIGFFVLEAGESEDVSLRFLKKRAALEHGNAMPLSFQADKVGHGERDQAKEMILRAEANKDLCVRNIYKDSHEWSRLQKGTKNAYKCFVSSPVLDWKQNHSQGLLTVDAPTVGDLTDDDRRWVRMLAAMLSHGLRDETAAVPVPPTPVGLI